MIFFLFVLSSHGSPLCELAPRHQTLKPLRPHCPKDDFSQRPARPSYARPKLLELRPIVPVCKGQPPHPFITTPRLATPRSLCCNLPPLASPTQPLAPHSIASGAACSLAGPSRRPSHAHPGSSLPLADPPHKRVLHTHTHTRARARTQAHAHTHKHTLTHTCTHSRTHAHRARAHAPLKPDRCG
jgi:hypothetical protein